MAINYSKVNWDTTKTLGPTNLNHMDDGIKAACDSAEKWDSISNGMFKSALFSKTTTSTFSAGQCQAIDFADVIVIPNGYKVLTVEDDTYRANLIASPIRTRAGLFALNYYAVTNINSVTLRVKVIFVKSSIYDNV